MLAIVGYDRIIRIDTINNSLKFKEGIKKRKCIKCGRSFLYDLSIHYQDGYICYSCHSGQTPEPSLPDLQTTLTEKEPCDGPDVLPADVAGSFKDTVGKEEIDIIKPHVQLIETAIVRYLRANDAVMGPDIFNPDRQIKYGPYAADDMVTIPLFWTEGVVKAELPCWSHPRSQRDKNNWLACSCLFA